MGEELDIPARAEKGDAEREGGDEVGQRAGGGKRELAEAVAGGFLAFRRGIGKESADGEQKYGAQAKAEPCGDEQARGFTDDDSGDEDQEEHDAAEDAVPR